MRGVTIRRECQRTTVTSLARILSRTTCHTHTLSCCRSTEELNSFLFFQSVPLQNSHDLLSPGKYVLDVHLVYVLRLPTSTINYSTNHNPIEWDSTDTFLSSATQPCIWRPQGSANTVWNIQCTKVCNCNIGVWPVFLCFARTQSVALAIHVHMQCTSKIIFYFIFWTSTR